MTQRTFRAATRGSALALWQTEEVARQLGIDIEIVVVQTMGDKTQKDNVPIEKMSGQGVFVKEVQHAVLEGRADFAVHSAKDLPSTTDEGLALATVLERGDARDCLIGLALDKIPQGGTVATGSVRRRAQLQALRPDIEFHNLRGNIDSRLAKAVDFDAIVLAVAGLERLDRTEALASAHVLDPSVMLPQVAQGALGVECREDDDETIELLRTVQHQDTRRAVDAERAFLAQLGSGCDLPVGAYATVVGDDELHLRTLLATPDGSTVLRREGAGHDPIALGQSLAEQILHKDGGLDLLAARVS